MRLSPALHRGQREVGKDAGHCRVTVGPTWPGSAGRRRFGKRPRFLSDCRRGSFLSRSVLRRRNRRSVAKSMQTTRPTHSASRRRWARQPYLPRVARNRRSVAKSMQTTRPTHSASRRRWARQRNLPRELHPFGPSAQLDLGGFLAV